MAGLWRDRGRTPVTCLDCQKSPPCRGLLLLPCEKGNAQQARTSLRPAVERESSPLPFWMVFHGGQNCPVTPLVHAHASIRVVKWGETLREKKKRVGLHVANVIVSELAECFTFSGMTN